MKFIAPIFALVFSLVAASPTIAEGYVHREEAISVTVEIWAREPKSPFKGESIRLPLKIVRDDQFVRVAELLARAGYTRADDEVRRRGLQLPDIRLMGSTVVVRGKDQEIVARSSRRFVWPSGFQLREGDVIRVMEFFF